MYIYSSSFFIGNQGLHVFGKVKYIIKIFLHDNIKLNNNKLEVWINKI